jgi:hypothetical protein
MNLLHITWKLNGMTERLEWVVVETNSAEGGVLMLKLIAAGVAACAVLAGVALAVNEDSVAGQVTDTPTDTPAPATDTPAPTASPATATATAGVATATPTGAAGTATATPRAVTVTPAAVPGTGGDPGSSTNLLLILAIGAGLVAGAAGLAGVAVTRRS